MSSNEENMNEAVTASTFVACDEGNNGPIIEIDDDTSGSTSDIPHLFKPNKVRVKEYWEIMSLVAPYADASREWKTSDAVDAYCTKCKTRIKWNVKNPKPVQRHMTKYHQDYLTQARKKRKALDATDCESKTTTINHNFSKKLRKDLPPASKSDQTKGEMMLVKWIAESLRPFLLVEDRGFLDMIDFLCTLHRQFHVPSRTKVRNQLVAFGEVVLSKMKEKINNEITFFSATTDIWSSRSMDSFMAITLHELTEDFEMINLTLEVEPLQGKHTGDFIHQMMSESFHKWGLRKENLAMMLRDNASNVIKACRDWGIEHFGCIGHTLHLIVGPLFIETRTSRDAEQTLNATSDENLLDDTVDYGEDELVDTL